MLEHVEPELVGAATRELARVARSWLLLKIANRVEHGTLEKSRVRVGEAKGQTFEEALARRGVEHERLPKQLHATVRDAAWWLEQFEAVGFRLHRNVATRGYACCAFVLRRV